MIKEGSDLYQDFLYDSLYILNYTMVFWNLLNRSVVPNISKYDMAVQGYAKLAAHKQASKYNGNSPLQIREL